MGTTQTTMALKSTIYKAALSIADIDHGYYADHALTLARHPSETAERMMIRILAYAINAFEVQARCQGDGHIAFGAGLSDPDEADLWIKDFQGHVRLWIDVGQPEDKPIARACQRAELVRVYCFSQAAALWFKRIESKLNRSARLEVFRISAEASPQLAGMADRQMQLQATIQDTVINLSNASSSVQASLERLR